MKITLSINLEKDWKKLVMKKKRFPMDAILLTKLNIAFYSKQTKKYDFYFVWNNFI